MNDKDKMLVSKTFPLVIVGHVDHGKSTLIGRLLYDTGMLSEAKVAELEAASKKRAHAESDVTEWSFALDSFQAERDQAVTIDTTQIRFKTDRRPYVIIDAPGHREFLKNMVSGAAQAAAAILVVDGLEGVQEQTRRHGYILKLLGIPQICVVINKMDALNFDQKKFDAVKKDVERYLTSLNLEATAVIPISARGGDMLAERGKNLTWYKGLSVLEQLDQFEPLNSLKDLPLRFAVQDVYKQKDKRIIAGRVESGTMEVGDTLLFSPTGERAAIKSFETWPEGAPRGTAEAGDVVGITLDQQIFVERGHLASTVETPPMLSNVFRAKIFWLSSDSLKVGDALTARYATFDAPVTVQSIDKVLNTADLAQSGAADAVAKNDMAEVTLRAREKLPLDPYEANPATGRVVLYDGKAVVGGGMISMEGYPDQRRGNEPKAQNLYKVDHSITTDVRAQRFGQRGGVFWFTGLSGAGKSTLAMAAEKALFDKGYFTYVLDGDNVRHGLNRDLGFSPDDRAENIRRVGEAAALMGKAGLICVTAFISPYRADRRGAREALPDNFHEIYIKADLETCEERDPKGLYKKARQGEIKEFTGIDSPYEAPANPELVVDTKANDVETCVAQIVAYIESVVKL